MRWIWNRTAIKQGIGLLILFSSVFIIPRMICRLGDSDCFEGDEKTQLRLAAGVEQFLRSGIAKGDYHTGSDRFSGEWLMGTYLMSGMGFGQTAIEHPEWRQNHSEMMRLCIERILAPESRAYDSEAWGEDPIECLESSNHHLAYLGYLNVLLSFYRVLEPESEFAALNDRITEKLAHSLEESSSLLLYTYPGEHYLPDNCALIASISLYDRATGADHEDLINRWIKRCRTDYVDPATGLLYQTDGPPGRGSGTAFGLYFLSFVDTEFSRSLYEALKSQLARDMAGFCLVREFPGGLSRGDIDSGPVILGYGVSATGFSIGGSRIHDDRELFSSLYASTCLFGAPVDAEGRREYLLGGPLGNALMFAMLTALPDCRERIKSLDEQ